jgi:hypothetical protein
VAGSNGRGAAGSLPIRRQIQMKYGQSDTVQDGGSEGVFALLIIENGAPLEYPWHSRLGRQHSAR